MMLMLMVLLSGWAVDVFEASDRRYYAPPLPEPQHSPSSRPPKEKGARRLRFGRCSRRRRLHVQGFPGRGAHDGGGGDNGYLSTSKYTYCLAWAYVSIIYDEGGVC